ncbi:serine hydrolase [Weizmannia coagulans]|uniref:serine-type D-Ala-D-Ala carboxypeptidase n=2 Tax=Heyndrickxia TaxID=2837504 RepID=G2THK9_HEYCO|nr:MULTISPECIES: serine hydrolase [Heyndrickxia]MBQ4912151.1 D-alanyl-D-alanine carboxypeptidase [Heyndrickxia faecalis]NWN95253.1 D-alanyl-D-alanine carboxypeptidase [Bacillus sp. (in: firmicutes)]AEP00426.1 peptidase S11 D-alanyl-D-alanine carboxypeptidase 1 [Heyndrickxia coagulans 36D1]AKN53625.1 D-alanyl-D-alanine carboxypeptidase [Heyndrickxia coagulans]ATW84639.1 D-alanyl-D-alanine carboxypeptidase [Heyndrickxia coagulans]
MKKSLQKMAFAFLALLLTAGVVQQVPKTVHAQDQLDIHAKAAIIVDADNGQILYEKNANQALGIASMSKMMTEYLLLKAIHEKKVSWNQKVTISDYAYRISQNRALSNVPLRKGEKYTVKELFQAMAIYSANGATIAIAETLGGTEKNYLNMMNKQAKAFGLTDYKFVNATGLNNEDLQGMQPEGTGRTEENLVSAKSVAKIAYHLIHDYPEILQTTSTAKMKFRAGTDDEIAMQNWNWMLPSLVYGRQGVDGLKTGNTDNAGYCFTGTAKQNGMRIITVVLHAEDANGNSTIKSRFDVTNKLMDYAFSNFTEKTLYPKGYQVKKTVTVKSGKEKQASVVTKAPLKVAVKNGEGKMYTPVVKFDSKQIKAPVKKGTKVGTLYARHKDGQELGYLYGPNTAHTALVTKTDIEKANWFVRMMRGIGGFFGGIWDHTVGKLF